MCAAAPANARTVWERVTGDPRDRTERQHPLKGILASRVVNGQTLEQWQYEVTAEAGICELRGRMMEQALQNGIETHHGRWRWRSLLKTLTIASLAVSIFGVFAFEPEIPIAIGVLVGIGLLWLLRPGRAGVIYTGVIHLIIGLVVLVLFQNTQELAYPASWLVFVSTGARLVVTIAVLVAAAGALLRDPDGRGSRTVGAIALLLLAAFVAIGIGSRLSVSSDTRQPGDLVLRITPETKWSPQELRVEAGAVSIYVENHDVHHGNFTIDGVVSFDIPAGAAKRAIISLVPGSYRYYSKLFPGESEMRGKLIAS